MRTIVLVLCLIACGCAERPAIGVVITNSPESLECRSPRGACR
jgi:hypothetical protein